MLDGNFAEAKRVVSPLASRKVSYGLCEAAPVHKNGLLVDERHFKTGVVHKTGLLVDGRRFKTGVVHKTGLLVDERHFKTGVVHKNGLSVDGRSLIWAKRA